ncbi:GDP-L-fucose synthase family protein [Cecembia calidifontis]|jgi:GDP-L-fucose synthase|uniref:GDP-L-fucose synthase n=1 Tax=Cecembia calidifontis TaxID=1187080 RepID=A0A4Q7P9X2_9BACT|nr:GDP-L-fucose synthase [Cecembia calidifontis]RZS96984.1 GDP-L-fucose synthase [Cecembia calidifontis]
MLSKESKIYVAGHRGMVGSAIFRSLLKNGYRNVIGIESSKLDLRNQQDVDEFFNENQPEVVIDAAARVGGILANSQYPYQFLMENLQIQNNLIDFSLKYGIKKFIFLGSSCIYPKMAQQPIKEEYLLSGFLEPTNEAYAISKIAGVKACEAVRKQYGLDYISLMPTNLYGPFDNFDLQTSHVLPAMIRKFHEAKENQNIPVELWGSGSPLREFLHVDDLAEAVIFSMENELSESLYNVGTGTDISIKDLAELIQDITGHQGEIKWDSTKPDGTPRKLLDVTKLKNAGWKSKIDLESGILSTYKWYIENLKNIKEVKLNF